MRVLKYLRGKFKRTLFFVVFLCDSYSNYGAVERTATKQAKYYTFLTARGVGTGYANTEPGNYTINCCLVLRGRVESW